MGAWGGGGRLSGGSVMMSVRVSGGVRVPLESVRVFAVGVKVSGVRVFGGVRVSLESVRVFAVGVKVSGVRVFGGGGVLGECKDVCTECEGACAESVWGECECILG